MSIEKHAEHIWNYFNSIDKNTYGVKIPSIPLLYLGNYESYKQSPLKILTVGTNPSDKEFPIHNAFCRFKDAENLLYKENISEEDVLTYLKSLNSYFNSNNAEWFDHFEPLLNGLNASYYSDHASTVLHTYMCSPLTTLEPWSKYEKTTSPLLFHDVVYQGLKIWLDLLDTLAPDIVLTSLGDNYRGWLFPEQNLEWVKFHVFKETADGRERGRPFNVQCVVAKLGSDKRCLLVFGDRSVIPFMISKKQKIMLGEKIYIILTGKAPAHRYEEEAGSKPEEEQVDSEPEQESRAIVLVN